jgi:hypothetical protein
MVVTGIQHITSHREDAQKRVVLKLSVDEVLRRRAHSRLRYPRAFFVTRLARYWTSGGARFFSMNF